MLDDLPDDCWGAEPDGTWATTRRAALARLRHFVDDVLPMFGPHEDAMVERSWHLAHSVLSPYLNIGLLLPGEVCDAVQDAYDEGRVPIASAEGFIRQVIGWREYVWGVYWLWMPEYRDRNELGADRPVPPAFTGEASTDMNCVRNCMTTLHDHAYNHHIQRLMVLGNLAMLHGVDPWEMTEWMWSSFIDGAEWVMLPNVIGMSQWADGGMMATKPYAAGGNYIDKMSDYCGSCRYDRKQRVGDDACPFTTLYWDFLARHHDRLVHEPTHRPPGAGLGPAVRPSRCSRTCRRGATATRCRHAVTVSDETPHDEPIFHMALPDDWAAAFTTGEYRMSTRGVTLEQEGFIHCSTREQLQDTANRFYADLEQLVVLTIDPQLVPSEIVFEPPAPGLDMLFPHIYGPLPIAAVNRATPWTRRPDASWSTESL